MYQIYLKKYSFSSKPRYFEFSFIQLNISGLSINTVVNPPTATITAAPHGTYFVAFSQSKTEVPFTRTQEITVTMLTKGKVPTIPNVFNVLLLNSSSDESYSYIPFRKSQDLQQTDGGSKHYFLQLLSPKAYHMGAVPCIQPHNLVQEPLIEESFTNKHKSFILGNSARYAKLVCSCSYMSSAAEESFSFSNAKMGQCRNEIYSSCIDIAEAVFSPSDGSSVISMKTELAVPHVCNIASANFPCKDAKLFECFGFTIELIVQRYGASYEFCYHCCLYVCYCNNAWLIIVYQTIVKHAGNTLCISGFFSAYFSADGVQKIFKKLWFAQYTECTVCDQKLNTDSMCTIGLVKAFALVGACKVLHVNAEYKAMHLHTCWMSKLEFSKPKQPSISLRSSCTEAVLCLQVEAILGQPLPKVLSGLKSNLTNYHHISITICSHFICNQKQIKSIGFYAQATQHNLQGSCIDSYNAINQCSVSVVSDESSTSVHTLSICQHRQLHTALLPYIDCKHTGMLLTNVTSTLSIMRTYLDIKKQQKIASFKRYSNLASTQLHHYCYTYGMYYKGFYFFCSTVQKQAILSIQCSLHLCVYHNAQPVLTLRCTCKYIYHHLCKPALCNGEAVVDNLRSVLPCSFGSYYFPEKQSTISTTNAQESVLDVPMLRMQDNLCSKDTTSCLTDIALASSCKNNNTDGHFKWHCTLPVETIQDTSNSSKETVTMEQRTNLPISVILDDKESSSQETIVNNKVTETTVNTTFIPAKNNKITALNATRSSGKETPSKLYVMKRTKKLDEWLFLHIGKVFICTCTGDTIAIAS